MRRLVLLVLAAALNILPSGASATVISWSAGDVGKTATNLDPLIVNDVSIGSGAVSTVSDVLSLGYVLAGPVTNVDAGNIVYMDFTLLSDRFQMNFALNNINDVPPLTTTITDALSIRLLDSLLNLIYAPPAFTATYDAGSGFYLGSVNIPSSALSGQWFQMATLSFDPSQVAANTFYIQDVSCNNSTPEPSTYALLCISLGVVGYARKRMNRKEV